MKRLSLPPQLPVSSLVGIVGNPLRWSTVDKCLGVVGVAMVFRAMNGFAARAVMRMPRWSTYADPLALETFEKLLWGTVFGWGVLAVGGLVLRTRRAESAVYVHLCLQYFWIGNVVFGWSMGVLTSAFVATTLGSMLLMLLLFGPGRTYVGMAPSMVVLGGLMVAERLGHLNYAPLLARQPFDDGGHPLWPWVSFQGGATVAVSAVAMVSMHFIVNRWSEYDRRLEELSMTDALTGALNRRAFRERATSELSRTRRCPSAIALVMVDIDHFKRINDTFGHATGDEVLVRVARALRAGVREHDAVARWGGEEFVVLLLGADEAGAATVARRLGERIARDCAAVGRAGLTVTATLGVAVREADGEEGLDQLLGRADEALYRGKNAGRNRVEIAERVPLAG